MKISAQLLSEPWQQVIRESFALQNPLVVHAGRAERLRSFVERGLVPSPLASALEVDEEELAAALGGAIPPVVCLTTPHKPVRGTYDGPSVQFAVQSRDLPGTLSLDWTMGGTWSLPDILIEDGSCTTWDEAFLETFRRNKSVVVMQCVPAAVLRIRTWTSKAHDPASWPALLATAEADIYRGEL